MFAIVEPGSWTELIGGITDLAFLRRGLSQRSKTTESLRRAKRNAIVTATAVTVASLTGVVAQGDIL